MDTKPILEVKDIVAGYGRMTILNGTTFSVPKGSITTVIGPNGAGKSTVFKTIFGMLAARTGTVTFNGRDVTNWTPRKLLEAGICYVPQGRNIFPELSVRTNIQLGAIAAGKNITDMPDRIERGLDRFPALRRKANQQAGTLSGGEQKQLEVVRGLLLDPQLILIDEPSIGLSPMMVTETFAILTELRGKGVSTLMIEQNARSALEMSDFGIVLELGQTRIFDTAQNVLNDPRVAQLFLGGTTNLAAATALMAKKHFAHNPVGRQREGTGNHQTGIIADHRSRVPTNVAAPPRPDGEGNIDQRNHGQNMDGAEMPAGLDPERGDGGNQHGNRKNTPKAKMARRAFGHHHNHGASSQAGNRSKGMYLINSRR